MKKIIPQIKKHTAIFFKSMAGIAQKTASIQFSGQLKKHGRLLILFALGILIIFTVNSYFPAQNSQELRLPVNSAAITLAEKDVPAHIENLDNNGHILAIRSQSNNQIMPHNLLNALQFIDEAFIKQPETKKRKEFAQLAPLLQPDGATTPGLFVNTPYPDPLDLTGAPLRWRLPDNLLAGYSVPKNYPVFIEPEKLAPVPKLPQTASSYQELVQNFAKRFNLSVPLVMAIIHSESDFSPTLVSQKSAMGLMQLLPSTASGEVHRFLYGRSGNVGFDDLRIPEINIHYGTAYLHILLNRYFSQIEDREIREICAIAAYNLGPNRFVKLYGATPEAAARAINAMGREAFLEDLPKRLPTRETRTYVEKVLRMKNHYAGLY